MKQQTSRQSRTPSVSLHHPYFYLSEEAAKNLLQFEYKGVDHSLIYKYILSPFAGFLVDTVTPPWLAPNLITLAGLVLMFIAYLLNAFYYTLPPPSSLYEEEGDESQRSIVPNWVFAINAAAMLIYQTLDNMDGKQARKTHSSSPLGLLFDHGCDAINSIFGSQMWIAAMAISVTTHPIASFICVMGPMALFFISTWEEYHSGQLILPIFNGPTEGLLLAACTMIVSYLTHPRDFWHSSCLWTEYAPPALHEIFGSSLSNVHLLMGISLFMSLREIGFKILTVMYKYGIHTCLHLVPFFSLAFLTGIIGCMDPNLVERNFTLFLHLISALFVEMVTSMMLDHLTQQKYQSLRLVLVPYWILAGLVVVIQNQAMHPSMSLSTTLILTNHFLDMFVAMYTTMVIVYLLFKGRIIIHEICMILGIYCFDIIAPRGPDYSAVQAVLSIFCFDPVNSQARIPEVVPCKEPSIQTMGVSTGVPSMEKKLV